MPAETDPDASESRRPRAGVIELTSAKYLPPGCEDTETTRQRIRELESAPRELIRDVVGGVSGIALLALAPIVAGLPGSLEGEDPDTGVGKVVLVVRCVVGAVMCLTGLYLFARRLPRLFRFWRDFLS